jgi:hypothetical protein
VRQKGVAHVNVDPGILTQLVVISAHFAYINEIST